MATEAGRMSVVEIINHYQKSIDKSLNDKARLLHCIGKLYRLPVSVQHLQDTGIGRTVNGLRKYDGEVGVAAKALVTKWKTMVAAEESDDGGEQEEVPEPRNGSDNGDDDEDYNDESRLQVVEQQEPPQESDDDESQKEESDEHEIQQNSCYDDDDDDQRTSVSHRIKQEHESHQTSTNDRRTKEHRTGKSMSSSSSSSSHRKSSSKDHKVRTDRDKERSEASEQEKDNHHSSGNHSSRKTSSRDEKYRRDKQSKKDSVSNNRKDSSHTKERESIHCSSKEKNIYNETHHSNPLQDYSKEKSSSKRGRSHEEEKFSDSKKIKKEKSSEQTDSSSSNSRKDKSNSRKNSSHERLSEDQIKKELSDDIKKLINIKKEVIDHSDEDVVGGASFADALVLGNRDKNKKGSSKDRKKTINIKKEKVDHSDEDVEGLDHTDGTSFADALAMMNSKGKHKKASSKNKKDSVRIKKERIDESDEDVEGVDNAGGASFADALAMIGMPSSSKKKASSKGNGDKAQKSPTSMPPPAAVIKKEKSSSSGKSRDSYSANSNASGSGYSSASSAPPLLTQKIKLEPLPEVSEIVESMPIISPHYKPMPLNQTVMECVFSNNGRPQKRQMSEEEAFGHSMQSKNLRTKVYSGVKSCKEGVPKLFDLCIRLLQENIDLIDSFGGIPFDLLKPVIERATPEQLFNLELYNPYLMEDTDVLWEQQCKRKFRSQKRKEEECESWREMYIRCSEERDAKLKSLTQNIKQSIEEKAAPVRKTQLAYVDSAVKPPRNVLSKQAKYGTDRTPVVSPAARVAALKHGASNVAKAGDSRLKVAAGTRDTAQVQVFQPMKPKKAPLMAKLMTSIKGFKTGFRR
ncbi:transcription elongation factor B polypeptide 3 [Malaya genurostris]|uniref:transcription elongation factor B polypeptide 3 n=1 Tax=Malaya genurostris TaxID=325434 RepID=UPI0026F3FC9F|nr:transcription elongation factor B polypeptide 3 [Malaya genurostris]